MQRVSPFLMLVIVGVVECRTKLSDLVQICSLNDPKLNECARKSAQVLLPILAPGIKDLHLIPLDPLKVPRLDFGQDTGPVNLKLVFTDATIKGTSAAIVESIKLDKNGYKFEGKFKFPRFELSGNYLANGRALILPIDGKGIGNVTTTDMDVHVKFNCKIIVKKNVQYLSIDKINLTFKYRKAYISFENLFGGNKELGTATNRFLNEQSDTIVEEMRGTLEQVFGELNKQLMNGVFENVPLSEAFEK